MSMFPSDFVRMPLEEDLDERGYVMLPQRTPGKEPPVAAENRLRTHCRDGHPFDADNTYICKEGRRCRKCWEMKGERL
jgi:hypothetical protein